MICRQFLSEVNIVLPNMAKHRKKVIKLSPFPLFTLVDSSQSGRGRGRGGQARPGVRINYPEIIKDNKLYQDYYNNLGIIEPDEQEVFWTTLRRELPNSFRFTGSKG